jgi:leucyl aminopeptidase (aminopeptidase T)
VAALRGAVEDAARSATFIQAEAFVGQVGVPSDEPVIISLASPLLTHTDTLRDRLGRGARYLNLRALTPDLLWQAARTDFAAVEEQTSALASKLARAHSLVVTDLAGTWLSIEVGGRPLALDGFARAPGAIGGFPSGEVAIVPKAGSAKGNINDPQFIEGFVGDASHTQLHVFRGRLSQRGEGAGHEYLLARAGIRSAGRTVGEFGLGTNPAMTAQSARSAKKLAGTAHFGVGDNRTFGGHNAADAHIDVILCYPTVEMDGEVLIDRGTLVERNLWKS